ncbi:MAG TPA: hypothetical protein VNC22_17800 [Sporichthya sp.]|nr:hypothetical protein [Sporichthya sp.]
MSKTDSSGDTAVRAPSTGPRSEPVPLPGTTAGKRKQPLVPPQHGAWGFLVAAVLCAGTLVASTLHVKSLIRERRNPAYTRAALVFALACIPAVALLALATGQPWWLAVPFVALAGRAVFGHQPTWRPGRIGMIERTGFVLVALTALLAF